MADNWLQSWIDKTPNITQFKQDIMGQAPEATYRTALPTTMSPNMRSYYDRMYGDVYERYKGETMQQFLSGQPQQQFYQWMSGFPWMEDWMSKSPYQRGMNYRVFNPRTRWLMWR